MALTENENRVKLRINSKGFLQCPKCKRNNRLQRITQDMVAYNLPKFCSICKQEIFIDVVDGNAYYHERPER